MVLFCFSKNNNVQQAGKLHDTTLHYMTTHELDGSACRTCHRVSSPWPRTNTYCGWSSLGSRSSSAATSPYLAVYVFDAKRALCDRRCTRPPARGRPVAGAGLGVEAGATEAVLRWLLLRPNHDDHHRRRWRGGGRSRSACWLRCCCCAMRSSRAKAWLSSEDWAACLAAGGAAAGAASSSHDRSIASMVPRGQVTSLVGPHRSRRCFNSAAALRRCAAAAAAAVRAASSCWRSLAAARSSAARASALVRAPRLSLSSERPRRHMNSWMTDRSASSSG